MRTKLIGILLSIMLLTTLLAVAQPIHTTAITDQTKPKTATIADDVPVWNIGDSWTYKVNELSLDISSENQTIQLFLSIPQLPLIVTETTGEYYTLSFTTTANGEGNINIDRGEGPVNISLLVENMQISGLIRFEKSTLGIKEFKIGFENQKFTLIINEQPYLPLPRFLQRLSVKVTSNIDIDSDKSISILSFPMDIGLAWNLSAANLSANGKIQSRLFNFIYNLNLFAALFGFEFLPPEIANLLPIIDIKEALITFRGGNEFIVPSFPYAFYCLNKEPITVPAGIFEAFNITIFGGIGQCFFAPAAGNIVLLTGDIQDIIPFIQNIDMELLETTYS